MKVTVRQGAAFVGLYLLMLIALVRPQMNFNVFVNSFLRADTSVVMVLSYRFDSFMAMGAVPLSAGTVYALSQWNKLGGNSSSRKMVITAVVCSYILVLAANFLANELVLQKALIRFDQCPRQAWSMYGQMAMSFVKSVVANVQSVITRQHVKCTRLTYRFH